MLFESLESRQVMAATVVVGSSEFDGNYQPASQSQTATLGYLSGPTSGDPLTIGRSYLAANATSLGISAGDVYRAAVTDSYRDTDDGTTHIYLQQTYNGLPVVDAVAGVHVTRHGQVIAASASFVPGLVDSGPVAASPSNSPLEAINAFASFGGYPVPGDLSVVSTAGGLSQTVTFAGGILSADPITAQLEWVPNDAGGVELAWSFSVRTPDGEHWYEVSVGARYDERMNEVIRVADYRKDAQYNVYAHPTRDPDDGGRTLVINPQHPVASPFGWHDTNGIVGPEFTTTQGNNVFAQEDINGDDLAGNRPSGGTGLVFDSPLNLALQPATYQDASITNLFYWSNLMHDVAYLHGFDEAAGNFQFTNYTGMGLGGDQVYADAQDGDVLNNAFMLTPPDGQSPRMDVGLLNFTNPGRDQALESDTILHEYFHGVSDRLTGGPSNTTALLAQQSGGMAEGWSDWNFLNLLAKPTDNKNTPRPFANYDLGLPSTGPGIRRYPYSFDMTVNPLTFSDYNSSAGGSEVHNAGEIWASALWDMTWLLIEKYGFDTDIYTGTGGRDMAMDIVYDALKLQPANPTFIQGRDAILAADFNLTGGANYDLIWQAFARRGLGVEATITDANALRVTPGFSKAPSPGRVEGTVYEDINGNAGRNGGEGPLAGVVVFVDADNDNVFDAGERSTVSAADGTFSFSFSQPGFYNMRVVPLTEYVVTQPRSKVLQVDVAAGQVYSNKNFGLQQLPGQITGTKFNDVNGNGVQDSGEGGLGGVVIYVDVNNDGIIGVGEPGAVTAIDGSFTIQNVRPGTYTVREVPQPGLIQTFPDPGTNGGAYTGVVVTRNKVTPLINFGNTVAIDYGDLPESTTFRYKTTQASGGPSHGVVVGFGLTLDPTNAATVVDGETDGVPTPNATGDDTNPTGGNDDENGVIIPALNPGNPVTITVGVRTGNNSPGYLQGWIDFNGDGDFADSGERIFTDLQLGTGIYTRTINVPATATLGQTFARFRYGYEQGAAAKSTGHALAGEVEDYVVNVLNDVPDARDDVFPRTGVDPLIKVGQVDVPLDVLANDIGSNFGGTQNPPQLVGIISPTTGLPVSSVILTTGSIVRLNPVDVPTVGTAAGTLLLYTPGPNVGGGSDSFQYQITDGTGRPIAFDTAMVTVNVNPPDPRAVDDLAFVTNVVSPAIPTATIIDVLANDRPIVGSTRISNIVQVSSLPNPAVVPTIVAGTSTTNDTLSFTPPVGFQGTIIYRYTINTPGIGTSDALLTIQVTPGTTTRGSEHDAQFTVEYVDINGNLTNTVNQGDDFFVRVYVQDFGVHTNIQNTQGAETAYLDLLVQNIGASPNLKLAEPVIVPNGSGGLRYDINFTTPPQGTYNQLTLDDPTISSPGLLNEVGATEFFDANGNHPALGTSPIAVMLVRFHALAAGQIRVQPDHAEGFGTEVVLQTVSGFPNFSIAIPDEFVFLPQAPALNIVVPLAAGEGFTNPENHYDVNFDTRVNAQDILTVINDLSTNGIRQLSQIAIGMSGKVPGAYVDTNVDSLVNVLDILAIINFMTATAGAYGEGEALVAATPSLAAEPTGDVGGAGDSRTSSTDAAVAMFTVGDDDVAVADPVVVNPEIFYSTTADEPHVLVVDPPPAFPTRGFGRGHGAEVATLDAEAADELFAKMDRFRDQLRQRIASRRR